MDILYNPDTLFKTAYNTEKNYWLVLLQGNWWEESHYEFNKKNLSNRVTEKSEFLKGVPKTPKLVESSVYTTKHVHYFSIIPEDLKWVVKDNQRCNVETGKVKIWYPYAWTPSINTIMNWEVLA